VGAEDDQHQVFVTGSAVQGPATGTNAAAVVSHAYADADANGFPVGLENTVASLMPGSGTLTITLRHLPPENDVAVKTGTLAEDAASSSLDALPGDTDVSVDFALTVE
jgi:D-alanyl-D-alanine carboxypeptidase